MAKIWKLKPPSPYASLLADETGISILQAQLLINRGISDINSATSFLNPRLSNLTDPMLLKDMDEAVKQILNSIQDQEKITIYGDYDVDGITSTALLLNFFSVLDIPVSYYIPDRLNEGYGLNPEAVERIAKRGCGLMITVDCGTANKREIELAVGRGMKVVVTDHHQVPEDFEPICPVINPHRKDSSFPFNNLAGVGVSFFLAVAVRAALRKMGWFKKNRPEPDLRQFLALVALGTVADMVQLLDQNRILVSSGIETMGTSPWPWIKAMQELADIETSYVTHHDLAFKLAPRLNAPGRMGSAETGIQLLTTGNPSVALNLAMQLNIMNSRRQSVERDIFGQVEETIKAMKDLDSRRTLVLSGNSWHIGVLGIVASRLAQKYNRPALVLNIRDGMATGSGRSIDGFNLYHALNKLGHLFTKFGGHYRAVGFTLGANHIEVLAKELEDLAWKELSEEDLIPTIEIDSEITLSDLTMETVRSFRLLSPFGSGNPEPLFYTRSLRVIDSRVVGGRHLKLRVRQGRSVKEAIGFGLSDKHPLEGKIIHMIFTPEINEWKGYEKIQLRIIDLEVMEH